MAITQNPRGFDAAKVTAIERLEADAPGAKRQLLDAALASFDADAAHCADAIARGDSAAARRALHSMIGGAGALGATAVVEAAVALAEPVRTADWAAAGPRLAQLYLVLAETARELTAWLTPSAPPRA